MKATIEQTTTTELEPELQSRLSASLSMYTGLKEQIALLEEMAAGEKAAIHAILDEAGASKVLAEGYQIHIITGTSSTLDKKKLEAQGVTKAMIEAATVRRPKKPYVDIRKQGVTDDARETD